MAPAEGANTQMTVSSYRSLPSVDRLLSESRIAALAASFGHARIAEQARQTIEAARQAITNGQPAPGLEELVGSVLACEAAWKPGLRPVINATGVVIHTNLGRAPL